MGGTYWIEQASGTATSITATRTAESNYTHIIDRVYASYDGSGNNGDLTVNKGTSTEITYTVHDDAELDLTNRFRGNLNEKVEASLASGGTGVVGNVTIVGHTERSA